MRQSVFLFLLIPLAASTQPHADKIPSAKVRTLDGSSFNTENISNNGKPIIICFWKTWNRNSIKELDNIAELYPDWQNETGVKLIAISIDDSRSSAKVTAMVKVKDWNYEVYLDINQDFKRVMNAYGCPATFLVNNNGQIVWQSNSYLQGSEDDLYVLIQKLAKNETLEKN
ncbi:MAG: TlpA disulfide reductase family protein [bacterium]|nr:TlpA disulfide reductase family protein [bacterium]